MNRKEKDIINRFYKDCGLELFKLRSQHKLSLLKLSRKTFIPMAQIDHLERGECREPWTLCKLVAFYGKSIKIELGE